MERTCVILKPDAVKRGLIGEIVSRFERCGLKISAAKLVWADRELIGQHYPSDEGWLRAIGKKAKKGYEEQGKILEGDELEIGKKVKEYLIDYMTSGPVFAMVLEGNNAIKLVRKLVGNTDPGQADAGTIRGDYTMDNIALSFSSDRAVRNLVHASGNKEEADYEIDLWFDEKGIYRYKRVDTNVILGVKDDRY